MDQDLEQRQCLCKEPKSKTQSSTHIGDRGSGLWAGPIKSKDGTAGARQRGGRNGGVVESRSQRRPRAAAVRPCWPRMMPAGDGRQVRARVTVSGGGVVVVVVVVKRVLGGGVARCGGAKRCFDGRSEPATGKRWPARGGRTHQPVAVVGSPSGLTGDERHPS